MKTIILLALLISLPTIIEAKKVSKPKPKVATLQQQKSLRLQSTTSTTVTLEWLANSDSVTGYRLYKGIESRSYTENMNVGNVLTGTFSNLSPDTTYYFAVSAYNSSGMESTYSNEVNYRTPAGTPGPTIAPNPTATPSPIPLPTITPGPTGINFIPATLVFNTIPGQQNVPSKTIQIFTSNNTSWIAHDISTHFNAGPEDVGQSSGSFLVVTPYNGLQAGTYSDPITVTASGLPTKTYTVTIIVSNNPSPTPPRTPTPSPTSTPPRTPTPAPSPSPSPSCTPCRCGN